MGKVTIRTSRTSGSLLGMNPWLGDYSAYDYSTINKGNNSLSKLEVVSALNSLNIGRSQYHFNHINCPVKYNPKVYLGTVQTASEAWNYDAQKDQTNGLPDLVPSGQKSGSLTIHLKFLRNLLNLMNN